MNEIIKVKQLPIIEEHLRAISEEVDRRLEIARTLVCTTETVKEVKKLRSEFWKDFDILEDQRKAMKKQIMAPYVEFERIYKELISDKYKEADKELKAKINEVQDALKEEKEKEAKEFFYEYCSSVGIDWLSFEMAGLDVNLTVTVKKLKEQSKTFIDKIADEIDVIMMQQDAPEILFEYQNTLELKKSLQIVKDRKEKIGKFKEQEEKREVEQKEEEKRIKEVDKLSAPKIEEKQKFEVTFTVKDTKEKIKILVDFMKENGIDFEQK